MDQQLETLNKQIESLHAKAQGLVEKLESSPGAVEEVQRDLKSVQDQIQPLLAERKDRLHEIELKDMKAQVKTLTEAIEDFRSFNPDSGRKAAEEDSPYASGEFSFFQDVMRSRRGDSKAMQRLEDAKAMREGTDSAGGYLVTPELARELIEIRLDRTPMRGLIPSLAVSSDKLQFVEQTGGLTAGWVAELAEKPSADMTFGQIEVSVFTAAGLAVASNQLLQDAGKQSNGVSVSIDQLIVRELAKRLAILEEIAILNGSGTGQPQGILGTSGVGTAGGALTSTAIVDLLDKVVDGIVQVQDLFKADPSHIVMHPRTWARIIKAREASAPSTYLVGSGSTAFGRRANDSAPGLRNGRQGLVGELFGYPVIATANMPTNLGAGTNESRVIVGAFDEALILDRQGVTVDTSEHVYFTSNQTVFRAEMRVGFTAARYPEAFSVISGTGLANG
jgi:HK97 family phage major capsid protein